MSLRSPCLVIASDQLVAPKLRSSVGGRERGDPVKDFLDCSRLGEAVASLRRSRVVGFPPSRNDNQQFSERPLFKENGSRLQPSYAN